MLMTCFANIQKQLLNDNKAAAN